MKALVAIERSILVVVWHYGQDNCGGDISASGSDSLEPKW
jgi:hypothetical protein